MLHTKYGLFVLWQILRLQFNIQMQATEENIRYHLIVEQTVQCISYFIRTSYCIEFHHSLCLFLSLIVLVLQHTFILPALVRYGSGERMMVGRGWCDKIVWIRTLTQYVVFLCPCDIRILFFHTFLLLHHFDALNTRNVVTLRSLQQYICMRILPDLLWLSAPKYKKNIELSIYVIAKK